MRQAVSAFLVLAWSVSLAGASPSPNPSDFAATGMDRLQQIVGQQSLQAKVVMTLTSSMRPDKAKVSPMEFGMMMSKGLFRLDLDLAKMTAAAGGDASGMPPAMAKMINISRPDRKVVYMVMPGLNGYVETPIPEPPAGAKVEAAKAVRTVEGTEKIGGYECKKVRNTVTTPDGTQSEVVTWEAQALQGLPIKMETETPSGKLTMTFTDIKTDEPDAALFEPPKGCKKQASMQAMMMSGMMNRMQD
jgi:hypothetical protein